MATITLTPLDMDYAEIALRRKRQPDERRPTVDSPLAWATAHRQIDAQPFRLDRFAPLAAIYADAHPHICVIKPAQRGVSEWAINYAGFALDRGAAAWAPEKSGLNVAYLFPTQAALSDFSKERFSGLRLETPYLATLFGSSDDFSGVTFRQIRQSYLYLRGGWSESALLSFAADVLILDEFDRMDPKAVALARRRLNASVVRRELDISTPTLPGKGIHALYLQSDQRVYEQPHSCGAWTVYDFFRDVRADGTEYAEWRYWEPERLRRATVALYCPACGQALMAEERCAPGRWTPQASDITGLRGYHVPALCWPFVDLMQFAVAAVSQDPSEQQEFYRSDLGLPYEVGGARITEAMLAQLCARLPNGQLPAWQGTDWQDTTMGVDVGARMHYRVSGTGPDGQRYVRAMGAVADWDGLDVLLSQYQVRQCVIDALPELHACEAWARRHPGQVLRALYPQASALAGQLYRVDEQTGRVQINRTMAMDGVLAAVAGAREHWPASIAHDPEVITHMTAPVRVTREDAHGQAQVSWIHTSPDHGYHAIVYDTVALATLPARLATPLVGGQRPVLDQYAALQQAMGGGQRGRFSP